MITDADHLRRVKQLLEAVCVKEHLEQGAPAWIVQAALASLADAWSLREDLERKARAAKLQQKEGTNGT